MKERVMYQKTEQVKTDVPDVPDVALSGRRANGVIGGMGWRTPLMHQYIMAAILRKLNSLHQVFHRMDA